MAIGAPSPGHAVALLCAAEVLSMLGFATFPALLPVLRDVWQLSGKEAGIIAGAYFGGYMLAVPLLSSLTDRLDARHVYLGSCLLAASGLFGFAAFAAGSVSAALFQAVSGAGLAGTYMPGLRLLTDRIVGARQSRYVAFYTSTFGIGTSASLVLAGWSAEALGWEAAFALAAVGPLAAGGIVIIALRGARPPATCTESSPAAAPGRLLADPAVRAYVLGYAAHCWELFGLRSWMVAFLAFCYALDPGSAGAVAPATVAAVINLLGQPASILGNEAAARTGRRELIVTAMFASASLAWLTGFAGSLAWWFAPLLLVVYNSAVMADSAALTAGLVAVAPAARRGTAMALYSFLGFGAGFLSPLAFGAVLDVAGGKDDPAAWGYAFGSLGLLCALAPVAMLRGRGVRGNP
jgi:MFS family permease